MNDYKSRYNFSLERIKVKDELIEALEAEVERMRELLADKILDTRIKYNPEVVKARLTELIKLGLIQVPSEEGE